jgi:AcrR family transcriptional regulator
MRRQDPAENSLTLETIAATSLAILDSEGPDALSFLRVGAALGTSHTTIHRHCGSIDGLLDICVDHLATELPLLVGDLPWATSTEARFVALYDVMNAHPALVALRRERPWLGPRVLERLVEPALQANLKAGLTPEQSIRAYRQMYLFTLGCSVFVDHSDSVRAARLIRTALAGLDHDDYPALTTDVEVIVAGVSDHAVFYQGLRHLIDAAMPEVVIPTRAPHR